MRVSIEERFNNHYELLKEYNFEFGNSNPKYNVVYKGFRIGMWANTLRARYHKGKLTLDRIKRLDEIGFVWDVYDDVWMDHYKEAKKMLKQGKKIKKNSLLDGWIERQRVAYANGDLDKEKSKLLECSNILLYAREHGFNFYLKHLKDYYMEHGNLDVPAKYTINGINLGYFINTRRRAYFGKNGRLIKDNEIVELNKYKVDWSPTNTKLLNSTITSSNKDKYYSVLNERVDHVLYDMKLENINEITSKENQEDIVNKIISKVFR